MGLIAKPSGAVSVGTKVTGIMALGIQKCLSEEDKMANHCWHTDEPEANARTANVLVCIAFAKQGRNIGNVRWCCWCADVQASVLLQTMHEGHGPFYATKEEWVWSGEERPCSGKPDETVSLVDCTCDKIEPELSGVCDYCIERYMQAVEET